MATMTRPTRVPLAEAALAFRLTRERLLRRVMRGEIPGMLIEGRWFIEATALPAATPHGDPTTMPRRSA